MSIDLIKQLSDAFERKDKAAMSDRYIGRLIIKDVTLLPCMGPEQTQKMK